MPKGANSIEMYMQRAKQMYDLQAALQHFIPNDVFINDILAGPLE